MTRVSGFFVYSWIGVVAAIGLVLGLPHSVSELPSWLAIPLAPASGLVRLWGALGWSHPAWLPIAAAFEALALGLAADVVRSVVARGKGRAGRADAAALFAWKAVILLALAGSFALYYVMRDSELRDSSAAHGPREETTREAEAILRTIEREASGADRRVVVLGDSLSLAAFGSGPDIGRRISKRTEATVSFHALAVGGLNLVDLEVLLDDIFALEPTVLMVQANVIFGKARPTPTRMSRWAWTLTERIGEEFDRLGVAPPDVRRETELEADPANAGRRIVGGMTRWAMREASETDPNYGLAGAILERARAEGIRTAIIQMPVTEFIRTSSPRFFDDRIERARELAARTGARYLACESVWPAERFTDAVHLDTDGSERLLDWLVPRITRGIEGDGS